MTLARRPRTADWGASFMQPRGRKGEGGRLFRVALLTSCSLDAGTVERHLGPFLSSPEGQREHGEGQPGESEAGRCEVAATKNFGACVAEGRCWLPFGFRCTCSPKQTTNRTVGPKSFVGGVVPEGGGKREKRVEPMQTSIVRLEEPRLQLEP
ncbi:hypothetical protein LZ31DRAFT_145178 [Colletotrichum somersetense]|nr:hypothetical protein LZ31DRAFT_145178 [Colletotrichum somersetense]